jgi:hypothetical protein
VATTTELENLLVRLTGDGSSYQRMLEQAQESTVRTGATIESETRRIEGFMSSLQSFGQGVAQSLAFLGIATALTGALHAFEDFEKGQIRLRAIIDDGRRSVNATMESYRQFVDSITDVTSATKEQVTHMLTQLEIYGKTEDQAKKLVAQSLALSAALGISAEHAMMAARAMDEGQIFYARSILHMRGVKDAAQVVAKWQDVIAKGFKIQAALTETASFQWERLQKVTRELTVQMGGLMAEGLAPVVKALASTIDWFRNLDPTVRKATAAVLTFVVAATGFGTLKGLMSTPVGSVISAALAGPATVLRGILGSIPSLWSTIGTTASVAARTAASALLFVINPVRVLSALLSGLLLTTRTLATLVGFAFSPVTVGAIAAGVALAGLVKQAGGLAEVWKGIKDAGTAAWEWLAPVRAALAQLFGTLKDLGSTAFSALGDAAGKVWSALSGGGKLDLSTVQRSLVMAILTVENWVKQAAAALAPLWQAVADGAVKAATVVRQTWDAVWPQIVAAAKAAIPYLVGIWDSIKLAASALWDWVTATAPIVWNAVADAVNMATAAVGGFLDKNEGAIASLVKLTVAAAGVYAAFKIAQAAVAGVVFVFGLLEAAYTALHVQQVISTIAWAAWTAAVGIAEGVVLLFNIQLAIWKGLFAAGIFLMGLWTGASVTASLATAGLTGAIALLEAVLTPAVVIGFAAAVLAFAGTLAAAGIAAGALYVALKVVWDTAQNLRAAFSGLTEAGGAMDRITGVLAEWWAIIQEVVKALSVDASLAWELFAAGARLALSQIADLWPPVWNLIKVGFEQAWNVVWATARESAIEGMAQVGAAIVNAHTWAFRQVLDATVKFYNMLGRGIGDLGTALGKAFKLPFTITLADIQKAVTENFADTLDNILSIAEKALLFINPAMAVTLMGARSAAKNAASAAAAVYDDAIKAAQDKDLNALGKAVRIALAPAYAALNEVDKATADWLSGVSDRSREAQAKVVKSASDAINEALRGVANVPESEATKQARKDLEHLRAVVDQVQNAIASGLGDKEILPKLDIEKWMKQIREALDKAGLKAEDWAKKGGEAAKAFGRGMHGAKIEAAESLSAEAITRMEHQAAAFRMETGEGGGPPGGVQAAESGKAEAIQRQEKQQAALDKMVARLDTLVDQGKGAKLEVAPAMLV